MKDQLFEIIQAAASTYLQMAPYLLLGFLIAGLISLFISAAMVQKHLGGGRLSSVINASLFGVPLPLCSCGVIPVAAMLHRTGAGKGATASFLLSTPQTGVDSILVTYSLLGPVIAIFRPLAALITGITGGVLTDAICPETENERLEQEKTQNNTPSPQTWPERIKKAFHFAAVVLPRDIGGALIIGICIAGLIGALLPPDIIPADGAYEWLSMVLMIFVGIPVYVCATASVPVAAMLILKGLSPGAAFVFLMTGPATNAATITTIAKLLGKKAAAVYLSTVAALALLFGFIMNRIVDAASLPITHTHAHEMFTPFNILWGAVLLVLLINALRPRTN